MIETLDYGLQFFVLALCGFYAFFRAVRTRDRGWQILTFFYACYALGDLYWLLCMALVGSTPKISYISEISWCASYIFLCLLLGIVQTGNPPARRWQVWLLPAFSTVACLFFFQWGEYIENVIDAALLARLGFLAVLGLLGEGAGRKARMLFLVCILFYAVEYGIWFSSCFWVGDPLANPYFWFDGAQTVLMALLAPAYRKAVAA